MVVHLSLITSDSRGWYSGLYLGFISSSPFRDKWSLPIIVKAVVILLMGLSLHYAVLINFILKCSYISVLFKLNVQMNHLGMFLKYRLLIKKVWVKV